MGGAPDEMIHDVLHAHRRAHCEGHHARAVQPRVQVGFEHRVARLFPREREQHMNAEPKLFNLAVRLTECTECGHDDRLR